MEPSRPYRREGAIKPHFLYRIATKAFTILQRPERKFPLSQGTGSVGPFRASNRPLLCPFSPLTARIKCVNGNTGSSQRPLLGLVASSVPWVQAGPHVEQNPLTCFGPVVQPPLRKLNDPGLAMIARAASRVGDARGMRA
jgi:hypothetical protein